MSDVTDAEAVDLLEAMLHIPSESGDEAALAEFLRGWLTERDVSAEIDEVGNVVGTVGTGGGPDVLLLSHLDTVPGQIEVRRDDEYLYGRGSCDAQGPLAAMIVAAVRRRDFPGILRVAGAVEEERLSRGGHHLAETRPAPDALIVGEPGGWDRVVLGYKGKLDLRYAVRRPPTHSTNPRPKASEEAVRFWGELLEALGPDRDHGAFGQPAATLRGITGGLTTAELDVDVRLPPDFDADAFGDRLRAAADGDAELTITRVIPAVRHPRSDPVVRALTAAIRAEGGTPRPTVKTGTSDLNTVSATWSGFAAAGYGPGDSGLDHSDEERIAIAEFLRGVAVLERTLDELAAHPTLT